LNGEKACEDHGYNETECSSIGCCSWSNNNNNCLSDVGSDPCLQSKNSNLLKKDAYALKTASVKIAARTTQKPLSLRSKIAKGNLWSVLKMDANALKTAAAKINAHKTQRTKRTKMAKGNLWSVLKMDANALKAAAAKINVHKTQGTKRTKMAKTKTWMHSSRKASPAKKA